MTEKEPKPKRYTVLEASELLGVTIQTVYRYMKNEEFQTHTVGGKRFIDGKSLRKFARGIPGKP